MLELDKESSFLTSLSNQISFKYNDKQYEYQFIVSSFYAENSLKEVIDVWKNKGFNFLIIENTTERAH